MIQFTTRTKEYIKLAGVSILIGFLCALLGDSLKKMTAYYEDHFVAVASKNWLLYILFPVAGLSVIHLLRTYLFKKKENKGIKEIFETLKTRHNELPVFKIPSHYINGFLTVIFGGSTGIEVSTVVASATVGAVVQKKAHIHTAFRKELIYAGVAAGVAALFNSPIAGILFSLEVISKKVSLNALISIFIAVLTVTAVNFILHGEPLFKLTITSWNYYAIPYFIVLGVIAGLNAVYLTKTVLFFKKQFGRLNQYALKILISAVILSTALLFFPQLYGDGYFAMENIFTASAHEHVFSYGLLVLAGSLLLFKPIVTSATLASGGDGGVFAPSLFMGAFLGLLTAAILNQYFNAQVIPVNFMVIGMAAVLSASLHAPFTAVFLVCGLVDNYILFVPLFIACLFSMLVAKMIYPYTVYTYLPAVK
ncbi:MAG: chloride channel protein [Sphingobacteriales bacterium]|nr:chloride channel protein [Sphingobacteriales bacterium]